MAQDGPVTLPVAVLLAGAGSSADFVRRAFGPALTDHEVVAVPPVPGPSVVDQAVAALDAALEAYGPRLRLVGGVSLGAHVAARWVAGWTARRAGGSDRSPAPPLPRTPLRPPAQPGLPSRPGPPTQPGPSPEPGARGPAGPAGLAGPADPAGPAGAQTPAGPPGSVGPSGSVWSGVEGSGGPLGPVGLAGVLLALPAWSGAPGPVAAATAAAADQVDRLGLTGALAAARAGGVGWVADELAAAWPAYGDLLAPTLRAAARSAGPSAAELAALDLPVGLVTFADDPLHPAAVAEQWVALLPRAALHRLRLADLTADRAKLGTAARAALTAAAASPTHPADPRPPPG